MAINIGGYRFRGPYTSENELKDESGVYAILCRPFDHSIKLDSKKLARWISGYEIPYYNTLGYEVIDIGESGKIKHRINGHPRFPCWDEHCTGTLYCAVLYTPSYTREIRMIIEQGLRDKCKPVCGKR